MKKLFKVFGIFAAVIAAGIYYYVTIPAVNIHAAGFWFFLIGALAAVTGVIALHKILKDKIKLENLLIIYFKINIL